MRPFGNGLNQGQSQGTGPMCLGGVQRNSDSGGSAMDTHTPTGICMAHI